jgi:hypothetical protein
VRRTCDYFHRYAFETYYKELLQELLAAHPEHFLAAETRHLEKIRFLVDSDETFTAEDIESELDLRSRHSYYRLFGEFSIPFLSEQETELIEYIFVKRNNYVHNAGKRERETNRRLQNIPTPVEESALKTEAKKLRTKMKRTINHLHKRVYARFDA